MQELNFPEFSFRFKNSENKVSIFDSIRKKFVILQPEEWVRQHCVQFLINKKGYPKSLINIEKELKINALKKRYDIVVFNTNGSINLIVECKAPKVAINQAVFDQIARYNLELKATYLMVTNGLNHYYCQMDFKMNVTIFKRYSRLQNMKLAIVILNWNGKQLLEQFLPSVIKYSREAVIYLADNASTDDSISFIKIAFLL